MNPSASEVSPGRLGVELEDAVLVHDVEDSLDTSHVSTASAKLVGVFNLEILKTCSFSSRFNEFFTLDQNLGVVDPRALKGGPGRCSVVLEDSELMHSSEDLSDTLQVSSTLSEILGVHDLELLIVGSFSKLLCVQFTLYQNLGVMDPSTIKVGP
jgi:hypothetical protein